jgi:hypothetical protein
VSIGSFVCGCQKKKSTHVKAYALKEVKRLCKEFGFTAGMLKGSLAEGRKKNG